MEINFRFWTYVHQRTLLLLIPMAARLPAIGTRISLNSDTGTVRFVGQVDNTAGIWIGVEWDDPTRGRHDGCKDRKRYFSCR
jgi:dynactin complex subunit